MTTNNGCCAGIDIGTNTILMVIGQQTEQGAWKILRDEHGIARLGEGLSAKGLISDVACERAIAILARYAEIIADVGVTHVRAVATSAMRDAANATEVRIRLERALGHPISVIDGSTEASLTFAGTVDGDSRPCLVVDIGGGSTECSYGTGGRVALAESVNVGVVRLTENCLAQKPSTAADIETATSVVHAAVASAAARIPAGTHMYAVAGTPVALAALELGLADFDARHIHGHVLERNVVERWMHRLTSMTIDELRSLPGIHPQRADVLPAGAIILLTIMQACGIDRCSVSTAGLRYGVMMTTA
ncbi:MAG: exopolyphosphatase [Candidatus Kapabacteria bacterium]|nr:exopolyphosphatase [Candidatus Kapabacteria bacterium]